MRTLWYLVTYPFVDHRWGGLNMFGLISCFAAGFIALILIVIPVVEEERRKEFEAYMEVCTQTDRTAAECETEWMLAQAKKPEGRNNTVIVPAPIVVR